ncbi:hypothetical protein MAA8898_04839 [Maliponia aquimaris]|uniref:Cytochrome c domain-containing protein n=1 Tax=Maliponia aquimaris TaxID=1673631 RepID=A0A238L6C7_9RHOB|nr:hypothetical protein MAA8898_04839 [Maliponia aquimaris]
MRLYAPAALLDSGLVKHILPRFTLKTRVRVELVDDPGSADLSLGDEGTPLFAGLDTIWHMARTEGGPEGVQKLADWLTSDIGLNTVVSYTPEGAALFGPPPETIEVVSVTYDGDAELGHKVSRSRCVRCHVVDEASRGYGIGSTPSFSVLRSLADWEDRFFAFYALNPHPSFTIVSGVTPPFPPHRPPPIAPVEMTLDEIEAVVAYVAAMPAADLGAPLKRQ